MSQVYRFGTQQAMGAKGEQTLDEFFSQQYVVIEVSPEEQRQGFDRLFYGFAEGNYRVEYKTDHVAAASGNAAVELASVERDGHVISPGWAYTSQADWLMYYLPERSQVYQIDMTDVRRYLPIWLQFYRQRTVPNPDYHTRVLLVPLMEFERIAIRVWNL